MKKLLVILGPTASGKTRLAVQLAHQVDGEIVSADSRQVYRDMDIGTGKDLDEYQIDGHTIRYHLINLVDAGSSYNVYEFQQDFYRVIPPILARGRVPVVCGGSGLYLESVLKGHQFTAIPIDEGLRAGLETRTDEDLLTLFHQTPSIYSSLADTSTRKRTIRAIEIATYLNRYPNTQLADLPSLLDYQVFGISLSAEVRRQRISYRLHERLNYGMIEEVQTLLDKGIRADKLVFYGLEYKFITQYLTGELTYDTMVQRLETAIHQFAKRQMTFFRKMERDGLPIHWLDGRKPTKELVEEVMDLLEK